MNVYQIKYDIIHCILFANVSNLFHGLNLLTTLTTTLTTTLKTKWVIHGNFQRELPQPLKGVRELVAVSLALSKHQGTALVRRSYTKQLKV